VAFSAFQFSAFPCRRLVFRGRLQPAELFDCSWWLFQRFSFSLSPTCISRATTTCAAARPRPMSMFALPREIVPVVNKQYVYVLLSTRDRRFYVGLTSDVVGRLQQHNDGKVPSTKARGPLALIYWEGCLNRSDAAQREKYLKSAWGKRYLKARLKNYLTGLTATSPSPR